MTRSRDQAGEKLSVGVIGFGAIGQVLAGELESEGSGFRLGGVLRGRSASGLGWSTLEDLVAGCDVIVEAAGQDAVREYAPEVLEADRDLLVLSVGAFSDEGLLRDLKAVGSGRVLISTGAIGGVDLLRAAALSGELETVSIRTTKPAAALATTGHPDQTEAGNRDGAPLVVFSGTAREVASRYPSSTNVAATIGLATLGMDRVRVELVADPNAAVVTHRIEASGGIGTYEFTIRNAPSDNPRTSLITPYAALRALRDLRAGLVIV